MIVLSAINHGILNIPSLEISTGIDGDHRSERERKNHAVKDNCRNNLSAPWFC